MVLSRPAHQWVTRAVNCNDICYTLFRLESSKIRLNLAIRGDETVRYPADILGAVALRENSRVGFTKLRSLVEANEIVGVAGSLPKYLSGWEVMHSDQARQLIYEDSLPATRVDAVMLTSRDVPEMLDLVN